MIFFLIFTLSNGDKAIFKRVEAIFSPHPLAMTMMTIDDDDFDEMNNNRKLDKEKKDITPGLRLFLARLDSLCCISNWFFFFTSCCLTLNSIINIVGQVITP